MGLHFTAIFSRERRGPAQISYYPRKCSASPTAAAATVSLKPLRRLKSPAEMAETHSAADRPI